MPCPRCGTTGAQDVGYDYGRDSRIYQYACGTSVSDGQVILIGGPCTTIRLAADLGVSAVGDEVVRTLNEQIGLLKKELDAKDRAYTDLLDKFKIIEKLANAAKNRQEHYRKMRMERDQLLSALRDAEWAAWTQGPGSGPHASGRDGELVSCCPCCKGINPHDEGKRLFMKESWDHRHSCPVGRVLSSYPQ